MDDLKLCDSDYAVMAIIWEHGPLSSRQLVEHCAGKLGWKKSTTYTVLKKLCERGIFQNRDGEVTSLISKQEYCAMQSEQFVEEIFGGSLPAFLAAFGKRKKLSEKELAELRKMIDSYREN